MNGSFFFLTLKRAFVRKTKTKNKMFKTLKKKNPCTLQISK